MNPQPELESDTLRSEINTTRDRMDGTIDALGNRLEGRHLVDELLGFFRGKAGDANRVREKLTQSAESAVHTVVDTVKAHPLPIIVAGAGIAWLIYETTTSRRQSSASEDEWRDDDAASLESRGYGTTGSGDCGSGDEFGSMLGTAKDKLGAATDQAREKLGRLGEQGKQTWRAAKDRVGEMTEQVQERSRELYSRTRERVVTTADQHPLEVGLGCLAAGFLVALALPTPEVVDRRIGPVVDRVRDRTRAAGAEAVEKGKRVVQAAANAAREEVRHQGLTSAGEQPGENRQQGEARKNENAGQASGAAGSVDAPQVGAMPGPSEARTTM